MKIKLLSLSILMSLAFQLDLFAQNPTDCSDAVIVCGNSNINLNVNGIGKQELGFGQNCSSQENNSVWLKLTPVTDGTLGFTLKPSSSSINEDYDFFVFGPNADCNNLGLAIRCSTTNPSSSGASNNHTGMNSSANDTSEGPGANGNSFVSWLNVSAGDTYFIVIDRPIGNSAFNLEWTGTAEFSDPPTDASITSSTSKNLENCDVTLPYNDGFTVFNLEENTPIITGSQTDAAITYHASESDAIIGINPISSPYTNIANPQTIYARITNNSTGCFEISEFNLIVNTGPDFLQPVDYELCDNMDDGNDKNGRTTFTLSSKNSEILDGQDPNDLNITYYESSADAESKNNPHPDLYYNTTAFSEVVFVRIEDKINPLCRSITSFNLVTNPNPEAFDTTLLQCDEDGISDGFTNFNLTEAEANLTGKTPDRSVRYFTDNARTIEVNGDAFLNSQNPQIIYTEVTNELTGCFSFSELTLAVSTTNSNNAALALCDNDGIEDGLETFNLNDADSQVVNGLPVGLNIYYYETYDDALLETNELNSNYTNTTPYNQTIFARVENANDCYGISEVELTVAKLPEIDSDATLYYCLNTYPELIELNAGIVNDSPSNYSYSWSTGATTYAINVNEPGIYMVTVTNTTGCSKTKTITVEASGIAEINDIKVDDVSNNNTITVLTSGEGVYEYRLINNNNVVVAPYQSEILFENVRPGDYTVSVKDTKNDCGVINKKVYVIGFPKFFTPNNDGFHDTWQVYGISSSNQPNSEITIYNRFGKLIKTLKATEDGWNGLFNGEKLPSDDYWFSIKLEDGRIFKDHFTLKY
ncbi:T9SS type B sorting domain-containing protein [Algibacter lectus]|uniref:T9SS type B sorting domain-containing protein n=1 Tax=Algibacter lectus TaxID=221126 RepID=UPI0026F24C9E|nr:T9SS type B sorting domain-containing protein [Algibacter lectus]MDO7135614.1 T9SS type B sorting domain-containing protein [Algibacter lectus]